MPGLTSRGSTYRLVYLEVRALKTEWKGPLLYERQLCHSFGSSEARRRNDADWFPDGWDFSDGS